MKRLWPAMACLSFVIAVLAVVPPPAAGQTAGPTAAPDQVETAPVSIDGRVLFHLRGSSSIPASDRAAGVRARVLELARNLSFDPRLLEVVDLPNESRIVAGAKPILRLVDADGEMEAIERQLLAGVYLTSVQEAITSYRAARTPSALSRTAREAGLATVLAALVVFLARKLVRLFDRRLQARVARRQVGVTVGSVEILRSDRLLHITHLLVRLLAFVLLLAVVFLYLQFTLGLLPWTRGAATHLTQWALAPLSLLGRGLVEELPNLVFLAVLFLIMRAVLAMAKLFFEAVGRGEVTVAGFEQAWANPTYQIVRLVVVALVLVVAYPYIPGSETQAFKGLTVFFGVLFSLGSTSLLSNIIAGYSMIYRRAFREGDLIRVGSTIGVVKATRLQATHLRTIKNEEVIIPNSSIFASEIVNFSTLSKSPGLILHTTVRINYAIPWRQVEAMLLEAASRTPRVLAEPKPFVHQLDLADFAVTYELNVYFDDPSSMRATYTELRRRILDVFNEYGVQIMVPAYEGDPAEPKVVPKDRWFQAPAQPGDAEPTSSPAQPTSGHPRGTGSALEPGPPDASRVTGA